MTNLKSILAGLTLAAVAAAPAFAAGALIGAPGRSSYIYMTHRDNPDAAANAGMSRCLDRYGSGCHVIKTYFDGCLAIAQSSDGSHASGWAWRQSSREANLVAVGQCARNGAACHLDVSVCE